MDFWLNSTPFLARQLSVHQKMPARRWPKSGNHATLTLMSIYLLYSWLMCAHGCVYTCTVHTAHCTVVSLTDQSIHPGDTTHDTHKTHTKSNVVLGFPDQKLLILQDYQDEHLDKVVVLTQGEGGGTHNFLDERTDKESHCYKKALGKQLAVTSWKVWEECSARRKQPTGNIIP